MQIIFPSVGMENFQEITDQARVRAERSRNG